MDNQVFLDYTKTCMVSQVELLALSERLLPEIERIKNARGNRYDSEYAALYTLFDENQSKAVQEIVIQKKRYNPSAIVVVGIGGSNLGTFALVQALFGMFYNEQQPDCKIYFADTVDSDAMYDILLLVEQLLQQEKNVILNIVSKSGTTTETIANAELFLAVLKSYKKDTYHEYVVVTTDKDSKLWAMAHEEHFACLEIPKLVGGRFSVFSVVGLFPCMMLGIDVQQLLLGARAMYERCVAQDLLHNPAAVSASLLAMHYADGITVHDTFLFSVDLQGIGLWYRQLMGESIGKEHNRSGDVVHVGITPTVSIGSTDLHSVGQLYLGGPRDKYTSFVTVGRNKSDVIVPNMPQYESLVASIQGKPFAAIMQAIVRGAQAAYQVNERPFVTWHIPEKNPFYLGQWMCAKLMEIIYLGSLLSINPFDQPAVESYKRETRKILSDE